MSDNTIVPEICGELPLGDVQTPLSWVEIAEQNKTEQPNQSTPQTWVEIVDEVKI